MSYGNAYREKFSMFLDVADGADNFTFKGPKGKAGKLIDYGIEGITEVFNAVTTPATIAIGNASDPDAYGEEFSLGAAALDTAGRVSVRTTYGQYDATNLATYILNGGILPADTAIYVTVTANTGGTPSGKGTVFCIVEWDD